VFLQNGSWHIYQRTMYQQVNKTKKKDNEVGQENSANIFMPSPLSQRLRVAKKGQTLTNKKRSCL